MPNPLVHRVARRHHMNTAAQSGAARGRQHLAEIVFRDVPQPSVEVLYSDGGIIATADVRRLLEPRVGFLANLRFRRSLTGQPNTIAWEGLDDKAQVVSGLLVLHAALRGETEVVSWADIEIDGAGVV
jgi:hypothetical protein